MSKTTAQKQDKKTVSNPVCQLRAESKETDVFSVYSVDVLLTHNVQDKIAFVKDEYRESKNLDIRDLLEIAKTGSYSMYDENNEIRYINIQYAKETENNYNVYITLVSTITDKKVIIPISEDVIEYFVDEYNITNISDITNLDVNLEIDSDDNVHINNDLTVSTEEDKKYHTLYKNTAKEEYENNYVQKFKDACIKEKNKLIKNFRLEGKAIVENVTSFEKDSRYESELVVKNIDTGEESTFTLDYPKSYYEENKVISYINDVGGGTVDGLVGEEIYISDTSDYIESKVIAEDGNIGIIDETSVNNTITRNEKYIKLLMANNVAVIPIILLLLYLNLNILLGFMVLYTFLSYFVSSILILVIKNVNRSYEMN